MWKVFHSIAWSILLTRPKQRKIKTASSQLGATVAHAQRPVAEEDGSVLLKSVLVREKSGRGQERDAPPRITGCVVRASGKHDSEMKRGVVVGREDSIRTASFRLFFFGIIYSVYQNGTARFQLSPRPQIWCPLQRGLSGPAR
jgi:hypothetical protein